MGRLSAFKPIANQVTQDRKPNAAIGSLTAARLQLSSTKICPTSRNGASSHKAKNLPVPENIRLVPLAAYAPELNPQEYLWDELREKEFPNRVFNHLDAVVAQLRAGLPRLAHDHDRMRSITAWPWIVSLNLNTY